MNSEEVPLKGMPPPYTDGRAPSAPPAVIYQTTVTPVVVETQMGPSKVTTTCPSCRAQIITRVEHKATTKTHLFAVLLFIIFCPCVCLPYLMDSCQSANHYCPNCNAFIGSYNN